MMEMVTRLTVKRPVVYCLHFTLSLYLMAGPQSAVCSLQSAVRSLQSAVCSLQSAVCSLQSAVRSPLSMFYTNRTRIMCSFQLHSTNSSEKLQCYFERNIRWKKMLDGGLSLRTVTTCFVSASQSSETKVIWIIKQTISHKYLIF